MGLTGHIRRLAFERQTAFSLHNNEPELIDNFALPLGSANQSVLPEWNSNAAERLRATCESRCRSLCMLQRMNTGLRDAAHRLRFRQRDSLFFCSSQTNN
jgi:hypothetical protein